MKNFIFLLSSLLILCACTAQNSPKTIYIVRHAEKQLEGQDPELAYVGEVRAKKLAQILEKEGIKVSNDEVQNFDKLFWDPCKELL